MKRIYITLLQFFLLHVTAGFSQEFKFDYNKDFKVIRSRTQDKNDPLYYPAQLKRFLENDSTQTYFETLALMIGFTANENFHPVADKKTEDDVFTLNANGKFRDAIAEGKALLAHNPLNLRVLTEVYYSYQQLKIADSTKYFFDQKHKVLYAMLNSGKGSSVKSPYFTLTPMEIPRFIEAMNGSIITQDLVADKKGNAVIVVDYSEKGDSKHYIRAYFIIQHAREVMLKEVKK